MKKQTQQIINISSNESDMLSDESDNMMQIEQSNSKAVKCPLTQNKIVPQKSQQNARQFRTQPSKKQSNKLKYEQQNNDETVKQFQIQDLYRLFTTSKYYLLTDVLKRYANQINDFLQQRKNVLFVFGPSGCGKTTLVRKVLEYNSILYDQIQQHQGQNNKIVTLGESILQCLRKMDSLKVHLCYDFPITIDKWNMIQIRQFKNQFSKLVRKTNTKTIFILNSQIYNSFYILNERAALDQNYNNRHNVSVIRMKQFNGTQIKKIITGFVLSQNVHTYRKYIQTKLELSQIIELSNGDLRKALLLLYWRGVEDSKSSIKAKGNYKLKGDKQQSFRSDCFRDQKKSVNFGSNMLGRIQQEQTEQPKNKNSNFDNQNSIPLSLSFSLASRQKVVKKPVLRHNHHERIQRIPESEKRFSLYHGLGKFLYGKRLNIRKQAKNKKQISCYYNEQEMKRLDPPFYFDPYGLFQQLRIPLDLAVNMLQENYLDRYGKMKDVRDMANIFRVNDGFFSFKNDVQDEEVKQIKIRLITWGILLYNRNSRTDNFAFKKIQKSQSAIVTNKVRQKYKLIRQYFSENKLSNLIEFAWLTKNVYPRPILNQTVFNTSLSRQHIQKLDDDTKIITQQQEQQIQTMLKLNYNDVQNKLRKMILQRQRKNKQLNEVFKSLDEQQQSDQISSSDGGQSNLDN